MLPTHTSSAGSIAAVELARQPGRRHRRRRRRPVVHTYKRKCGKKVKRDLCRMIHVRGFATIKHT